MRFSAHGVLGSVVVSLAAAVLAAGCGAGGASSGGTSAGGGGTSGDPGSITLTVNVATSPGKIGVFSPDPGRTFVAINLTLDNVSAPSPIPVTLPFFSLSTANGLALTTSAKSAEVYTSCAGDTSISAGSQYTCSLAFEVPTGDSPKQLSYDDHVGHTASAPVSITQPEAGPGCNTTATWTGGSTACGQCMDTFCKGLKDAANMEVLDNKTCPTAKNCINTCMTGTPTYCSCLTSCLGACEPAWDTYQHCVIDNCTAPCM